MQECGMRSLKNRAMKTFLILLLTTFTVMAASKEEIQKQRNTVNLELTKVRLQYIEKNEDLKILHNNILRTHGRLASIMAKHPELIKNKDLKEPELSKLKLKLMIEDEDLSDIRASLVKMHRRLEALLLKDPKIKSLTDKLDSLEKQLK